MFQRNLLFYSTPIIQLLIGLCIGIAFSIIVSPFREQSTSTGCKIREGRSHGGIFNSVSDSKLDPIQDTDNVQKERSVPILKDQSLDYNLNNDDYEPRIKAVPVKGRTSTVDSSRRPRYISTELGIREKLFVGVLTKRETLDTLGVAVNRTVSQYATKTVFFMNNRKPTLPSGMSLVVFNEENPHSTGLQMLTFIGKQYVKNYDWFYIMPDTAYLRAKKLLDLVSRTSVNLDVLLGHGVQDVDPMETQTFCHLGAGILLSQSMMFEVVRHLDWCQQNLYDRHDDMLVSKCIRHGSGRSCNNNINNEVIQYMMADPYSYDLGHSHGNHHSTGKPGNHQSPNVGNQGNSHPDVVDDQLLSSLSVSRVDGDVTIYKLHRYFCEHDLRHTESQLESLKRDIREVAYSTPDVNQSLSWPLGVDPPSQPHTRFDVIRWDYFTTTHIYLDGDGSNMRELKGVDKEDVADVMKVAMEMLSKKYNGRYTFRSLMNGYRRFDATRGMDYILDIGLYDRSTHQVATKRVKLMRPLGYVELVPMPYVTENSRVNLVLPVTADNRDSVVSFLDSYAHTCLESGDNTYLFVVFIYGEEASQVGENDKYSVLKSMISFYENKYQNGARIAWTTIQNPKPSLFNIMDTISRKFSPESLFLLCTVGMDLSIEFLNRVRMNTIANWQVFFPIGFWQYKPNLVHDEKPYPTTIEIEQKGGHFDPHSFTHASFYNSDYQYARKQMISTSASKEIDLFEMFLHFHTLHMFRAVEPALKLSYREVKCEPTQREDVYHRCLQSRGEGLASQAQLAMLIFEHQQKLDQLQMNVMHQQNGPNVGQMKPDMLR